MDANYVIDKADRPFGRMKAFGPMPSMRHPQLEVPGESFWEVTYPSLDLLISLHIVFSGQRLEIQKMVVEGLKKEPVQTRDLTQLGLPKVLHDIAALMIPHFEYWTKEYQDRNLEWESLKSDDEFLSQLMWVNQVAHGNARKALMDYFAIPRSTATLIIKRLKGSFPMPLEP
jgi:hypothetical protein